MVLASSLAVSGAVLTWPVMVNRSETDGRVLHALRLRGIAQPDRLAPLAGRSEVAIGESLTALRDEGLVSHRQDPNLVGWALTTEGRDVGARLLVAELDAIPGARDAVLSVYRRFGPLNRDLLEICTRWQLRGPNTVNDHADADHDRRVIDDLRGLDRRISPLLGELVAVLPRCDHYRPRFDHAMNELLAGGLDWFARPMIDSYHTIWFELHEDLLATLGLDRATEERA